MIILFFASFANDFKELSNSFKKDIMGEDKKKDDKPKDEKPKDEKKEDKK